MYFRSLETHIHTHKVWNCTASLLLQENQIPLPKSLKSNFWQGWDCNFHKNTSSSTSFCQREYSPPMLRSQMGQNPGSIHVGIKVLSDCSIGGHTAQSRIKLGSKLGWGEWDRQENKNLNGEWERLGLFRSKLEARRETDHLFLESLDYFLVIIFWHLVPLVLTALS